MRQLSLFIVWSIVLLAGCRTSPNGEPPADSAVAASFNSVMLSNVPVDPVTTMVRTDEPTADWSMYREFDDLEDGNCYDIAVSRNAVQRFLAHSFEGSDGEWRIAVRAGIGNNVWGTQDNDARLVVPEGPEFGCIRPYINHIKDDLYGVLWIVDGTLYSAVYAPNNTTGFELTLGDSVDGFMDGVSIGAVSLTYYNDSMRVIWMRSERDRIMQLRGQASATEMSLFAGATYTALNSTSHSDVVAGDDGLYIAAASEGAVRLFKSSGVGNDWLEVNRCDVPWEISHSLLYVDQQGEMRTLVKGTSITNERTISFEDCSRAILQVPIGNRGRIKYSSGT